MEKNQAIDVIRRSGLSRYADLLIEHLLPSARVVLHDASAGSDDSVASHFGGLPSLPSGVNWPAWDRRNYLSAQITRLEDKFRATARLIGLRDIAQQMRADLSSGPVRLQFLAQLSLGELHATAPLQGWPHEGTMLFFCEPSAWGFDPLASGHCRVLYFPAREKLAPTPAPSDLPDEVRFPQRSLSLRREWTLPNRISINGADLSIWGSDDYRDLCQRLVPKLSKHEPIHRCGGHPQEIQGDMRLECQLVTNGIYCGDQSGYRDPRRSLLEKGAAEWQLLLQVDSDENRLGWMWGDAGRVYFWARQQEIEAANFDGSWAVLQCH